MIVVGTYIPPPDVAARHLALAAREAALAAREAEIAAQAAEVQRRHQAAARSLLCTAPLPDHWDPYDGGESTESLRFIILPYEGEGEVGLRLRLRLRLAVILLRGGGAHVGPHTCCHIPSLQCTPSSCTYTAALHARILHAQATPTTKCSTASD